MIYVKFLSNTRKEAVFLFCQIKKKKKIPQQGPSENLVRGKKMRTIQREILHNRLKIEAVR